jgi:excisionase family DNA binding protein
MGSAYARGRPAILNKRTCITQRKKKQKIIQMPSCLPRLVSAEVVAESTGMSVKHVYRLAQLRQIPHYRIGGTVRFDPQEIAEWLELQRIAA